jgi:deoxyribonuclease V
VTAEEPRRGMKKNLDALRFDVTPSEGIAIQKRLASQVVRKWDGRTVRLVAGTDVHFPSSKTARAVVVLCTVPDFEIIDHSVYVGACTFPYVPGLLSFREIPVLMKAWRRIEKTPDLVLCDGQGIAHPRGLGLASHFGLAIGIPTIGCAKSRLFGSFEEPGPRRGERSPLLDKSGGTIGTVLRTRDSTRPIYVSIGHLIDLRNAVKIAFFCSPRYRIPEPLRAAHRLAGSGTLKRRRNDRPAKDR